MSESSAQKDQEKDNKNTARKETMQAKMRQGAELSKKGAQAIVNASLKGTEFSRSISRALIEKHPQVASFLDVCLANSVIILVVSIVRLILGVASIVEFSMYNLPLLMFSIAAFHRVRETKKQGSSPANEAEASPH